MSVHLISGELDRFVKPLRLKDQSNLLKVPSSVKPCLEIGFAQLETKAVLKIFVRYQKCLDARPSAGRDQEVPNSRNSIGISSYNSYMFMNFELSEGLILSKQWKYSSLFFITSKVVLRCNNKEHVWRIQQEKSIPRGLQKTFKLEPPLKRQIFPKSSRKHLKQVVNIFPNQGGPLLTRGRSLSNQWVSKRKAKKASF